MFLSILFFTAQNTSLAYADIVIATVGPITGKDAAYGEQMRIGATTAVDEINAAGGVLGEKVVLKIFDDRCEAKLADQRANEIIDQGIKIVIGHFCSHSSIPAAKKYFEENVLMITPASTRIDLTQMGFDNVFRFIGRDDEQAKVAGNYIVKHYGDKNVAIVHDKQSYSQGLADEVKKYINGHNINEVFYETITPGEADYTPLVAKIKQHNIDLLYYGGYYAEAGKIVRQMREQALDTVLFSGDGALNKEFWAITGDGGKGTLMTFGDPRQNKHAQDTLKSFDERGIESEGFILYTYGATKIWADAANKVGSTDPQKVAEALKSNRFDTVLGNLKFDQNGDFDITTYAVQKWENGGYNPIDE